MSNAASYSNTAYSYALSGYYANPTTLNYYAYYYTFYDYYYKTQAKNYLYYVYIYNRKGRSSKRTFL